VPVTSTVASCEAEVRRLCAAGELHAAATVAIRGLGPELLGFLVVLARNSSDASDCFSELCVRLWRGLPTFRWDCSLRTWSYLLARFSYQEHRRQHAAWGERRVGISEVSDLDAVIADIRNTTLAKLREQQSTRAERLRQHMTSDEQALLTLRVDRNLEWREIARILSDDNELDDAALTRATAGVRKRFERLREKLRKLAAEDIG
jgi:RNA polymerase sigma-70 factor, ECF subfamily